MCTNEGYVQVKMMDRIYGGVDSKSWIIGLELENPFNSKLIIIDWLRMIGIRSIVKEYV